MWEDVPVAREQKPQSARSTTRLLSRTGWMTRVRGRSSSAV